MPTGGRLKPVNNTNPHFQDDFFISAAYILANLIVLYLIHESSLLQI